MAQWSELRNGLRERYQLAEDEPNMVSLVWTYDEGRSQKVILRRFVANQFEILEIKSAFARRGDVEPEVLMRVNAQLPLATTALSGDVYLVVYNVLCSTVTPESLDTLLGRVAAVADHLEEKHCSGDRF